MQAQFLVSWVWQHTSSMNTTHEVWKMSVKPHYDWSWDACRFQTSSAYVRPWPASMHRNSRQLQQRWVHLSTECDSLWHGAPVDCTTSSDLYRHTTFAFTRSSSEYFKTRQLLLYITQCYPATDSRDITTYFPKFKKVMWPWTYPFRDNLSCIHHYSSVSINTQNLKCLASPMPKIW